MVVVAVVASGAGIYYYETHKSANCTVTSRSTLIWDQAEKPDTLDPAVTFTTPGWAAVQQVYQGMVNYNGSSYTTFEGVLAKNWSTSHDGFHWNFTLRAGAHFSNGDVYNAYTQWFSFYRSIVMNQAPTFILTQNFWYPGLTYYSNATANAAAASTMANFLNTTTFASPNAAQIQFMEAPNQSFQVINANTLELNLGFGYLGLAPYTYLLASISAPNSYAIDPAVVQAHGGVWAQTNAYFTNAMIGTGPYTLSSYDAQTGYALAIDPNFWGASVAAANPTVNLLQPAKEPVQIQFQQQSSVTVQDLKTGAVAGASFAYLGPDTVKQLQAASCVTVQALPDAYGATGGSWWIYMNQATAPFNNLSVREAVAHAINYAQIIQVAFGGYATQWVGPVPPSYPYYNPQNLAPYPYNLTLAKQEMANSPYPNGYSSTINYAYLNTGPDWADMAVLLKSDLAQIGINLNLVPITLNNLYAGQLVDTTTGKCTAQESVNGGPFPIGQEFYTSDYISPDDWTQNDAVNSGSANLCMSGYNNTTVNSLVYAAASDTNTANLTSDYTKMTQLMYNNYTDIWMVVPTAFAVFNPLLHGYIENPMASAEPYSLCFNTQSTS
ncbi:MAG: ABC transporter substrate-binding protein [Thermoplasmata archaeon]|nr:ABC transporter substrate-binding protein [Thermoplasmata archaeon]